MPSGRFGLYYWGPISYYAQLIRYSKLNLEGHDSYVKQSYRNRCYIDSPNGELLLNIPIDHQHKGKMLETRYNSRDHWQQKHWQALLTSYNSSPFFDALAPELQAFYKRDYPSLAALNFETTKIILQWLRYDGSFSLSKSYDLNPQEEDDHRDAFDAKRRDQKKIARYVQVFDHKTGFKPELSILDLIFNEGPATWDYLQQL